MLPLFEHTSTKAEGSFFSRLFSSRRYRTLIVFLCFIGLFYVLLEVISPSGPRYSQRYTDLTLRSPACTAPVDGKPLLSHVLVIDAGSTGSRLHVYRFNHCEAEPTLEDEVFIQVKPGLSAYPDDPTSSAHSLNSLLDAAKTNVPEDMHACTPITVKATAGLRLLGSERSARILAAVKKNIKDNYPFRIVDEEGEGIAIMDGKDEGVYAWITVNYLLHRLASTPARTAAIMDLGGGSTQIVFEPGTDVGLPSPILPGDHRYSLAFGGQEHILFQHSYLGYGLMEARRRVGEHVATLPGATTHPCVRDGEKVKVTLDGARQVELTGSATKGECGAAVRKALFDRETSECPIAPCSFDGVYQPSLTGSFPGADIYAFSYVYDRFIPLGLNETFTLADAATAVDRVCRGDEAIFGGSEDNLKEWKKNPSYCLDASFILGLLRDGYEITEDRRIQTAKKIGGFETGWCLGAAIALMDRGLYCQFHELQ